MARQKKPVHRVQMTDGKEISFVSFSKNTILRLLKISRMDDLVESIKQNGVLTPVLVRPDKNSGYEMISGHRRMHAR